MLSGALPLEYFQMKQLTLLRPVRHCTHEPLARNSVGMTMAALWTALIGLHPPDWICMPALPERVVP